MTSEVTDSGFDLRERWSMPEGAPLVPEFPFSYWNVSVMTVVYETDRAALRALTPDVLEPVSDVVMIHLYDMPDVQAMGAVHECNVMTGCRVRNEPSVVGGYTLQLYIDSDVGLAHGREIHGQPKKFGKTRIKVAGDTVVGSLHRNGIRILRATTPYKQRRAPADVLSRHFDFANNMNAKVVRGIDGDLAVCQITSRRLLELSICDSWHGPTTIEISPHVQAPLHLLPVIRPVEAVTWRADFTLGPGEVLIDLLE